MSAELTFLFTDIEGSTRLWEQYPEAMQTALARHDELVRQAIEAHGGQVFKTMGDAFCAAFQQPTDGLNAALVMQRALQQERWASIGGALRVRVALHSDKAEARDNDYFGPAVNRVARMLAAAHGGQILLSASVEAKTRSTLPLSAMTRNLGEHRLKDLTQPESIFQLITSDLPSDFPPLRSLEAFVHNLPAQLTSFVGREKEIAEVKRLLTTTHLLTLTGVGGTGKTRLALHVAADLLDTFANGAWLVELAPVSDPTLLERALASTLGIREDANRPLLTVLVEYLRPKQLLLVLDNCEHVIQESARLAESLLRACPQLKVLATSREALGVPGETPFHVPSLSLPDVRQLPLNGDLAQALTQYEAVRLFVERATSTQSRFQLTAQNARAIAEICHRLDGIPLALELAAARVRAMPIEQLSMRLSDRFRLLTGGSRTALPRQQTLQALIDWSHDLLPEPEKILLRRLSVFAGGWTLEAAEYVADFPPLAAVEVLDLVTHLVDKSLVVLEESLDGPRYRLLETIRQYARDKLLLASEGETTRDRHLEFFTHYAERAAPELWRFDQVQWLDRLEIEHDNLRAALEWSLAAEDLPHLAQGQRLASNLGNFWLVRGYWSEGREWFRALLERPEPQPTRERAWALAMAGFMASAQNARPEAEQLHTESLALSRALGDQRTEAYALWGWADSIFNTHGRAEREAVYRQSLALFRQLDEKPGQILALGRLAGLSADRDRAASRAFYEENMALCRAIGHRLGLAGTLNALAFVERDQGNLHAARGFLEEARDIFRAARDKSGLAGSLGTLGLVLNEQVDYPAALAAYQEALALNRDLGGQQSVAGTLIGLSSVQMALGDVEGGRRSGQEAQSIVEAINDRGSMMGMYIAFGEQARQQNNFVEAERFYLQGEAFCRQMDQKRLLTVCLHNLGHTMNRLTQTDRAKAYYAEAIQLARQTELRAILAMCLGGLGGALLNQPAPLSPAIVAKALQLIGAMEANLQAMDYHPEAHDQRDLDFGKELAHTHVSTAEIAAHLNAGRALTLEQAAALAEAV